jgi:hypothetical protein
MAPVIRREEWGADESLGRRGDGGFVWPAEFEPVAAIVIHHTHGLNADPDPARTIREIHRFHTIDRGWGDIGYNFLIDSAGAIYEGRTNERGGDVCAGEDASGRGVVGAHARTKNRGSIGIALLGTYDDVRPTDAAVDALRDLVAGLAVRHGLDVAAADSILGHGDVAATTCPGWGVRQILGQLRIAAAEIAGR